jgi:mRNA interferase HigB
MRITSRDYLLEASRRHADATSPLLAWTRVVEAADWRNLADVHQTYPHADAVKLDSGTTVTIFNIGGNKYRLLTAISYPIRAVNVLAILTHAEYDKEKWKKTL